MIQTSDKGRCKLQVQGCPERIESSAPHNFFFSSYFGLRVETGDNDKRQRQISTVRRTAKLNASRHGTSGRCGLLSREIND